MEDSNSLVYIQWRRSDTTMISIDCRSIFTSSVAASGSLWQQKQLTTNHCDTRLPRQAREE